MLPTDLEFEVLTKFFRLRESIPARGDMVVRKRSRSEVGFFTEFEWAAGCADQYRVAEGTYENIPNARVFEGGELVGFLLFVASDMTFTLEGHVYGEKWPAVEFPVEFLN
ncbi:hypothetical protein RFM68_20850 [Mesorhizobium sp. MSK_1335]|uniref:Uncharacterized protein n=1 Tax=Mesorhizobium montanum TaxID=3072323 RepID=A0ABU4ZNR1_9HYPH|nr:hypothetical protein [Mesorhizobium sp. MSK_1335]MDX8526955.1 hypothetical protein [Mesorhizobium sp. MSK_1335]